MSTPPPAPPPRRPEPLPAKIVSHMTPTQYRVLQASTKSLDNLLKGH